MNHMDKIWVLLGLDEFEKFNIIEKCPNALRTRIDGEIRNPYYFTDEGLICRDGVLDNHKLAGLITGEYGIERSEKQWD